MYKQHMRAYVDFFRLRKEIIGRGPNLVSVQRKQESYNFDSGGRLILVQRW